ncbi:hypothetical protein [Balneola vulgaris]|uniref:hypothetical protein n=1 Tax=Balneola vulgaris TaxID=287535 RepID=UPI00039AA471|nr:hypothetical protein [Balneola vulgaris]
MTKFVRIVTLLIVLISSKSSLVYSQEILDIKFSNSTKVKKVEAFEAFSSYQKVEFENFITSSPYEVKFHNEKWIFISKPTFQITIYDGKFKEELVSFGRNGRGPGEGGFIQSYSIVDNFIYLYDSTLRKISVFKLTGEHQFDVLNDHQDVPYHINDLEHISGNMFIATGITLDGYASLNKGDLYKNLFLVNITRNGITPIDAQIIHPDNISNGIQDYDIVSSTVTSPYKFSNSKEGLIFRNQNSNQVYLLVVKDEKISIKKKIQLGEKIFQLHPIAKENEFNRSKKVREEWLLNGSFLIDVYENDDSIFFYTSNLMENYSLKYRLTVLRKQDYRISDVIDIMDNEIIRRIDDSYIYTVSYNSDSDVYEYGKLEISSILNK